MTSKMRYGIVIILAKLHRKVQCLKWPKNTSQTPLYETVKNVSQMLLLIQIIANKLHGTWLDFRIYQNLYSRLVIAWVMHVLHMQHFVHSKGIGPQRSSSIGCQLCLTISFSLLLFRILLMLLLLLDFALQTMLLGEKKYIKRPLVINNAEIY